VDEEVSSATIVEALSRLGISEQVARLTLSRMVERGYFVRRRQGRRMHFLVTDRCREVLRVNRSRLQESLTERDQPSANQWTLLSFSIPEVRRRDRRALRVKLAWEGFGPLRDGVWIAAGERDVSGIVRELELDGCIDVFVGQVRDPERVVRRVWELDTLRVGYDEFLRRWDTDGLPPEARDELGAEILLITEWRMLVRAYPRLPPEYLDGDWPVARCEEVVHRRRRELEPSASRRFREILDAQPGRAEGRSPSSPAGRARETERPATVVDDRRGTAGLGESRPTAQPSRRRSG
jgi:phenylacetic acid degradation operon negative regulatory protein